jgi:dihydropteroate synthase
MSDTPRIAASEPQSRVLLEPKVDSRFQVRQIIPEASGLELQRVQFDESYRQVAEKKFHHLVIKASALSAPGANILKQTCLTLGAEAGVHRGAINCTVDREAVLITATQAQLERLILKLRPQPFGLKLLAESISRMLQRQRHLGQKQLEVMAILNMTPDSFSDGGRLASIDAVIQAAQTALDAGAKILDVGGESTRPGASCVPVEEELARVIPVVQALRQTFPQAKISIDTRKAMVALRAVEAGANWVNDVSGCTFDPDMMLTVIETGASVVMMHSQGTPETMQQNPHYDDVVGEIARFFYQQLDAFVSLGGSPNQVILDPGFGFGKTLDHNLEVMRRLPELVSIGFPVLVGTSRKSFLTLGRPDDIPVTEREALTAASLALAIQSGASILRVHDVSVLMPVIQWVQQVQTFPLPLVVPEEDTQD